MNAYNYIAIEGNIGSGKTSLATLLANDLEANLILEEFDDNPFLPAFYQDPDRYSFQLELSFLAERYQQLKTTLSTPDLFRPRTISDYLFYKCLIFARTNLGDEEFGLYSKLFNIIYAALPKPDLLVFLFLPMERLMANIRKRGRNYEQDISEEYLYRVQQSYFDFFKQQQDLRVLIVDTRNLDFVQSESDYHLLKNLLDDEYPIGVHQIVP